MKKGDKCRKSSPYPFFVVVNFLRMLYNAIGYANINLTGDLLFMFKNKKIAKFLTPGRHVHLVGIGGVSMRPLGLVLKGMGMEVTGSDMSASAGTEELERQGIPVAIGHHAENIEGADCIIRTAAAHNDNPEIAAARAAGIPDRKSVV